MGYMLQIAEQLNSGKEGQIAAYHEQVQLGVQNIELHPRAFALSNLVVVVERCTDLKLSEVMANLASEFDAPLPERI